MDDFTMLVTLGTSDVFFNTDDVLYVQKIAPDAVYVVYAFGDPDAVHAQNYSVLPAGVEKVRFHRGVRREAGTTGRVYGVLARCATIVR